MGSFGEKLKREREMRAITLEEIAEATKIGTRSLRALEEEHFDQLPGGIFNKGFVRAYAKFLGIDEEQAVADYMTATNEVGNSTSTQMAALAEQVEQHRAAKEAGESKSGNAAGMVVAILVIVIVAGVGFGGYKMWQARKQQREAAATEHKSKSVPPPVAIQQPTPVPTTPASTTDTTSATSASATDTTTTSASTSPITSASNPATTTPASTKPSVAPEFPITVTLRAVKPSWIQVNADGKVIYSQTMGPNDQQLTLHGKDKMQLTLGNAGGVELSFNGKPVGSLGQDGQTRKLTITPQGMEQ